MSEDVDQKAADDSALAGEPVDQAMKMTMCKRGDVTHLTLEGETSALMHSFGTTDGDFLAALFTKWVTQARRVNILTS